MEFYQIYLNIYNNEEKDEEEGGRKGARTSQSEIVIFFLTYRIVINIKATIPIVLCSCSLFLKMVVETSLNNSIVTLLVAIDAKIFCSDFLIRIFLGGGPSEGLVCIDVT